MRVKIEWVKGHKSSPHNKAADKLAKKSAEMPFNKAFSLSETAKKWTDRKTKRGCIVPTGQTIKIRIVSREHKKYKKCFEYRYEVIDPSDKSFGDADFVYCEDGISRHKCLLVRFNDDPSFPFIEEILEELDAEEYKYKV